MSFPVIALERELSSGLEWINATRLHSLWMPDPRATGGRGNSPPIDSGNEWTIPPLTVSLTSLCSPSTLRLLHMFDAKTYFCLRYRTVYIHSSNTEVDTESALGSSPCTIIRLPEIRSLRALSPTTYNVLIQTHHGKSPPCFSQVGGSLMMAEVITGDNTQTTKLTSRYLLIDHIMHAGNSSTAKIHP